MIQDTKRIDSDWSQSEDSCMLAAYAIAGSYFTCVPVSAFFESYCRGANITFADSNDAERQFSRQFQEEWQRRNVSGTRIILELHGESEEKVFVDCRTAFECIYHETSNLDELEQCLRDEVCFLWTTYSRSGGVHAVLAFFSKDNELYVRDTSPEPQHDKLRRINKLCEVGTLGESILIRRIINATPTTNH